MPDPTEVRFRELVLEKVTLGMSSSIDKGLLDSMTLDTATDVVATRIILVLRTRLLGNQISREVLEVREIPKTWWDAFKKAFFPSWLARWFPVRVERVEVVTQFVHVCPHLISSQPDVHFRFLSSPSQIAAWRQEET